MIEFVVDAAKKEAVKLFSMQPVGRLCAAGCINRLSPAVFIFYFALRDNFGTFVERAYF